EPAPPALRQQLAGLEVERHAKPVRRLGVGVVSRRHREIHQGVNLALAELRLAPNVLQESADPAVVAAVVAGLLSSLDDVDFARLALRQPELRELVERVR